MIEPNEIKVPNKENILRITEGFGGEFTIFDIIEQLKVLGFDSKQLQIEKLLKVLYEEEQRWNITVRKIDDKWVCVYSVLNI